jgi:hypothetical protein
MIKISAIAAALAIVAGCASPAAADVSTTCRSASAGGYFARACETVITRPAPEASEPSSPRGAGTTEIVRFDPVDEARKLAIPKHDPASINLCPAPRHYDRRDGCQR